MKNSNYSSKIGLFIIMLQLTSTLVAQENVFASFKGKVVVNGGTLINSKAVVTDEYGTSMAVFLSKKGNFRIHLPLQRSYTLTIEKPGYITKEIHIDLSEFNKNAERVNSMMEFDVVMYPQDSKLEMAYIGAVGEISFDKHTGKMLVEYNHRLIPMGKGYDELFSEEVK